MALHHPIYPNPRIHFSLSFAHARGRELEAIAETLGVTRHMLLVTAIEKGLAAAKKQLLNQTAAKQLVAKEGASHE